MSYTPPMLTPLAKRLSVLLVISLGLTGVVYAKREMELRAIRTRLEDQTAAIDVALREVAEEHVLPFVDSSSLKQNQRKVVRDAQAIYSRLSEPLTLAPRVATLGELLRSLRAFQLFSPGDAVEQDSLAARLAEQSELRDLLDRYNDDVALWNGLRGGLFGSLTQSILSAPDRLPYLRMDGQEDFLNVVEL